MLMIDNFKNREHHTIMDFLIKLQQKVSASILNSMLCTSVNINLWYVRYNIFLIHLIIHFWNFVVLRRDLLSEKDDLKLKANENKGGPYDPEIYRFPKQNIKDTLVVKDVTNQLLNSRLALATPGTCVT